MRPSIRRGLLAPVAASLLASGCVAQGLAFRVDTRLHITSPKDRAEVTLPLRLSWTIRDFAVRSSSNGDDGGSFAIFVDRSPIPPGKTLAWLARKDSACTVKPGCPDAAYLAPLGIYETTETSLELRSLPLDGSTSPGRRDRHHATIILLDHDGKRIGEIAYDVTFDLKQKDGSGA